MTTVILPMIRIQDTHPHLLFFKATSKPFLHDWICVCLSHLKPSTCSWLNNLFCFPHTLICLLTQLCLLTNVLLILLFCISIFWQGSLPYTHLWPTPSGAVSQPWPQCVDPQSKMWHSHIRKTQYGESNSLLGNKVRANWIMKSVKPHPDQGIRPVLTLICRQRHHINSNAGKIWWGLS